MTIEQLTIRDYEKGQLTAEACSDVLLTAIERTHPGLYEYFAEVSDIEYDDLVPLLEELL